MQKFNKQDKQQFTAFCNLQCVVMSRFCKRYNVTEFYFADNGPASHFCAKHTL